MASFLVPAPRMTLSPNLVLASPSPSSPRPSLTSTFLSPCFGGNLSSGFSGMSIRPVTLTSSSDHPRRSVVAMVIPYTKGSVRDQPPPDLASYLFKNRIVYLGMPLIPSVTELMLAEFFFLQYESDEKPIYFYINSTGTTKGERKLGYETEALAIYDITRFMKPPIFTLCVGNAWGEASLLLTAGAKGNRSALPSSSIMMKQPISRFQGQATDVGIRRKEIGAVKAEFVKLYAKHIGKSPEEIEADIRRPKYFTPTEAVEYGIIDKVLHVERGSENRGVVSNLKNANLI